MTDFYRGIFMAMRLRYGIGLKAACLALLGVSASAAHAAAVHPAGYYPTLAPDTARVTTQVDNNQRVTLQNSLPALAQSKYDTGELPSSKQIKDVTLLLKRSDTKEQQFEAYLDQLHNPSSPYFHHWLTAAQIGTMFGPAQSDITKVVQWLQSQGLQVLSVSPTGMTIHFSGTTAAIGQAFHTSIHGYTVNNEAHFSNATSQQIPAALTPVVARAPSLGNFFPKPLYHDVGTVTKSKQNGHWQTVNKSAASPQFTVPGGDVNPNVAYDVAPADFNTIYNVTPLWQKSTPIRGAGETVAVLERSEVLPADIQTFRSAFLPAGAKGTVEYQNPVANLNNLPFFQTTTTCTDPARLYGDENEAALDAEWAGAAAPDATIIFATCDDKDSTTFGPFQAAENLLTYDVPPPVMSLSYGECESASFLDGSYDTVYYLWQEAAAEGVTVFVASGDSGSMVCDQDGYVAYQGLAVNAFAATPYNIAIGGTDFNDINHYSQYWTSSNLPLFQSAVSYIPEQTWNDTCASSQIYPLLGYSDPFTACNAAYANRDYSLFQPVGGSGGQSTTTLRPEWQIGVYGMSQAQTRLLPDMSLFAANGVFGHALIYCMSDATVYGSPCNYSNPDDVTYNTAGGTSFAAPTMAGIQALVDQAAGQKMGEELPALYDLAMKEYGTVGAPNTATLSACNSSNGAAQGSNCVFNDVTVGDNAMPCGGGSNDCYTPNSLSYIGVSSAGGSTSFVPAWTTNAGFDEATGLGTVNATNLVNALVKFYQPFKRPYVAPADVISMYTDGTDIFAISADGFSDITLVDPVKGILTTQPMKGSIAENCTFAIGSCTLPNPLVTSISPGYKIAVTADALGEGTSQLYWTGPDNRLYVWQSNAGGIYYPSAVGNAYPAGWQLIAAGVNDNSGIPQLFWFNPTTSQFGWWKMSFDATTGLPIASIGPLTTVTAGYVPTLADVNGDGYADIVWTSPSNNLVYIWINNQHGGFVTHIASANRPEGFTLFGAGDLNGDGTTDLIWTNPATNQMAWWLMNGFNVEDQETRSVAAGYTMAAIADYDGDGLADILWVGTAGDAYEWQSNGSGFQSFRVVDPTGAPYVIPSGAQVQVNRLQGLVTGTISVPGTSASH
jgi:Pro-kumamolisin, activation domain/FG-GAP-like repeat/Subtilase family